MHMKLGKMEYNPVDAVHATSDIATGILGFRPQRAAALENDGKIEVEKRLQEEFNLPVGIQIKMYERY